MSKDISVNFGGEALFEGAIKSLKFIDHLRNELSNPDYVNSERVKRDVDKACSEMNENQGIGHLDIHLLTPSEIKYASLVLDLYVGYEYTLIGKFVMRIKRKERI